VTAPVAGERAAPSKELAHMFSSTTPDTASRMFVGGRSASGAAREPIVSRALAPALCSPAGLCVRPWVARLRRALREQLFVLHFQPIVGVADRRVSHHEALLRLADEPDGSLLAPGRFLAAAERHGLVGDIDRMVIDRVAALLGSERSKQYTQERPHTRIAVNVSALSVTDPSMLSYLAERLRSHGAQPAQLVVEVTETAAISDMDRAKAFCAGVLALGCEVALDDFGAGFGSFQYLKHLPFSYLKIDGDFVRNLPVSRTDQLVVSALAGVVRDMGRRTIAEFVGDETTMSMLLDYGVDYAQGYQIGRPRPLLRASAAVGTAGASPRPMHGR
jgi:EAL domain-containing protein (putative c-di-GMP-specific phosphodiesterase class I)